MKKFPRFRKSEIDKWLDKMKTPAIQPLPNALPIKIKMIKSATIMTQKQKGIYKRGSVYWIRYTGIEGKTRYESSKSGSIKVAEKLLVQRKNDVMEGKAPVKEIVNYTFRELSVHYLKLG